MSPSRKHESIKKREAGTTGKQEHWVRSKRLDVFKKGTAIEVQTTVTSGGLLEAARRLKSSGRRQKVLMVPKPEDVPKAARELRKAKTGGLLAHLIKNQKFKLAVQSASPSGFGENMPL